MLQLDKIIEVEGTKQTELASVLGVSEGRVSQVLNTPGNLTLRKIVQYAKAVGRKVSLVVYDDGDTQNQRGPISGEIFTACWEQFRRPLDNFDFHDRMAASATADFFVTIQPHANQYGPNYNKERSATTPYNFHLTRLTGTLDGTANNTPTTQNELGVR